MTHKQGEEVAVQLWEFAETEQRLILQVEQVHGTIEERERHLAAAGVFLAYSTVHTASSWMMHDTVPVRTSGSPILLSAAAYSGCHVVPRGLGWLGADHLQQPSADDVREWIRCVWQKVQHACVLS